LPGLRVGGTEGDAEEAQLRERRGEAAGDQLQLGRTGRVGELQQLQPVADGAHRAYEVVAKAGADEAAEVQAGEVGRAQDGRPAERRMNEFLEPGNLVRHPERPDWGLGQVQSMIGGRITVNFENAARWSSRGLAFNSSRSSAGRKGEVN
jgi:hypothetical protein